MPNQEHETTIKPVTVLKALHGSERAKFDPEHNESLCPGLPGGFSLPLQYVQTSLAVAGCSRSSARGNAHMYLHSLAAAEFWLATSVGVESNEESQ